MLPTASPEVVGMSSERLQRAFGILQGWLHEGTVTAIAAIVARRGKIVGEFYRGKLSPLVALLHSIDGPPRITHIWPYASIDARFMLRAEAVAKGIWPPKGAPEWLTGDMQSTIALPTAISPLA